MAIYRFRVTFEEDSDIFRDIEIKSTQNFEDFHNAIINAYKFNNKYKASFYKSDDNWEMEDEIALCKKDKDQGLLLMKDCKLVRLITAPHQRFIYVHDPVEPNIFNIELLNIATEHNSKDYPFCSKSEGEAPIKDRIKLVLAEDEDEDFFDETEDEIDDGEAYEDAIDTDDLDDMAESSEAELEGGNDFSEEASKDYDEI